jgi:twinkle protein
VSDNYSEFLTSEEVLEQSGVELLKPSSKMAEVQLLYQRGIQGGVSPGWPEMAQFWTLRPGDWTLVTGVPSHGKTSFMNAVMVNTARLHGWHWLVWCSESLPHEMHIADLLEQYVGMPFNEGYRKRMSAKEVESGMAFIEEHFRFIQMPEEKETVDHLLAAAEASDWPTGLYIDPWNELNHPFADQKISETEYISRSLKKIRRYASRAKVHVIVVAHPQKPTRGKDGTYPIPNPYDVSGSSHWRNKADCALCVWRDEAKPGETTVFIQKIRRKAVGRTGSAEFQFDVPTGRYFMREPGSDDE